MVVTTFAGRRLDIPPGIQYKNVMSPSVFSLLSRSSWGRALLDRLLSPERIVRLAYQRVVERVPTDYEIEWHCERMATAGLAPSSMFENLAQSREGRIAASVARDPQAGSLDDLIGRFDSDLFQSEALSPEMVTRLAYRLLMNRAATPTEITFHSSVVRDNLLPNSYVFKQLVTSPEYEKTLNPSHAIRLKMVERIPRGNVIVDYGGSCPHSEEGALYFMGYRPRAKRLVIIDLPPPERYEELKRDRVDPKSVELDEGVVEYVHGSFAQADIIDEGAFADLVWSGCSIEHVTREAAETAIANAWKFLKPGGHFCLDTCNREITRYVFGDDFCHHDHDYEYTPDELAAKVTAHGFELVDQVGLMDCSAMRAGAGFGLAEQMAYPEFTDKPEDAFLFYQAYRKPG